MKVVDSSVRSIPVDGLAAGNLYQVHVESISLSGTANSRSMSFETEPASDHQQIVMMTVILSVIALLGVLTFVFCR